jgi:SAM-dependent methyltransferase
VRGTSSRSKRAPILNYAPTMERLSGSGTTSDSASATTSQVPSRWRLRLRRSLDRVGLSATAYDLRARARHAFDRHTKRSNASFRAAGAPDRLPLPPPSLVYLVAGHFNLAWYYASGAEHAALLRSLLAKHGYDVGSFASVLDFGCGCGRVTRHWHGQQGVHGSDANPRLVEWCRRSFPFATFDRNAAAPPLDYEDERFDFIYAISVFTHLPEPLQHAWMQELQRVLAPGGLLALTTKGESRLDPLDADERRRFDNGELIVHDERYAGRNLCAAFHPEQYVRNVLAPGLACLDFLPASRDSGRTQDFALFRRPPAEGGA